VFPGIFIDRPGTDNNEIKGNFIGTDVNGSSALGNAINGITISLGAKNNSIGGIAGAAISGRAKNNSMSESISGEGNLISGNEGNGIEIRDLNSNDNRITGNFIGTNFNGTTSVGNSSHGILITNGTQNNSIGGVTPEERNFISGNGGAGILVDGTDTDNNKITGNYIGTEVTGSSALGNAGDGVTISGGELRTTLLVEVILEKAI